MRPNEGNETEYNHEDLVGEIWMLIHEGRKTHNDKINMKDKSFSDVFKKFDKNQKDLLTSWKLRELIFLEVWLHRGETFNANDAVYANKDHLLLEQWRIEIKSERNSNGGLHCTHKMLLQAIKSKLYFSQLSAWLSLSQGKFPRHVYFRFCQMEDKTPLKTFILTPDFHQFPHVALDTRTLIVSVHSLPHSDSTLDWQCYSWVFGHTRTDQTPKSYDKTKSLHDERSRDRRSHVARRLEFGSVGKVEKNASDGFVEGQKSSKIKGDSLHEKCLNEKTSFSKNASLKPECCDRVYKRCEYMRENRNHENNILHYDAVKCSIMQEECHASCKNSEQNVKSAYSNTETKACFKNEKCKEKGHNPSCRTKMNFTYDDVEATSKESDFSCGFIADVNNSNGNSTEEKALKNLKNSNDYECVVQRKLKREMTGSVAGQRLHGRNYKSFVSDEGNLKDDDEGIKDNVFVKQKIESSTRFQQTRNHYRHASTGTLAVFHPRTGLPMSSSPAPFRKTSKGQTVDDMCSPSRGINASLSHQYSLSAPTLATQSQLLGNFEESVLNGRLPPDGVVEGFTAELSASGSKKCLPHVTLPVLANFFKLSDDDAPSPYMGYISLDASGLPRKGYHVPKKGTIQLTLFNPNQTVVKVFVVLYDFSDMQPDCQTCLRQKTTSIAPSNDHKKKIHDNLHYLIHLRFASSKSGRVYLHTDIRVIFPRHPPDQGTFLTTTSGPTNPKYAPRHDPCDVRKCVMGVFPS